MYIKLDFYGRTERYGKCLTHKNTYIMTKREARLKIGKYFAGAVYTLFFVKTAKGVIADVEYQDFLPEYTVRRELSAILGDGYLLNVKRECSDAMRSEIARFLASDKDGFKLDMLIASSFYTEF